MLLVSALPLDHYRYASGITEWTEMLFGTTIATSVAMLMIFRWRRPDFSVRHKTLAITGFCLWLVFWVLTFAAPHGGG